MDHIFARCADLVALAGAQGIELEKSVERVLDAPPRPALVNWLHRSFAARPAQFTVSEAPGENGARGVLRVVASQALRERAMGFSLLEHAPLQAQSMQILEAVGQAGQAGVLQSELGAKVGLSPVMVHHYLGALVALKLVARRKVVLTSHKAARIDVRGVRSMQGVAEDGGRGPETDQTGTGFESNEALKPTGNITQTAVIVLARFASHIDTSNATEQMSTPAGAVPMNNDHPIRAVFNVKEEVRVERVLKALNQSQHGVMPQRDLKLIAIPSSECPETSPYNKFVRRRHRIFRVVRARMLKANLVKSVMKECVNVNGKSLGELPCFQLPDAPSSKAAQPVPSVVTASALNAEAENDDEEILSDGDDGEVLQGQMTADTAVPVAIFELDVAEQIYQSLELSGARGMSCPDVVAYLDGDTGQTGIEYKRARTLMKSIDKTNPIQNLQHFDGSACHKRFVLKKNHVETGREWPCNTDGPGMGSTGPMLSGDNLDAVQPKKTQGRRATTGSLTTLGEGRRKFVRDLLQERKVLQLDKIGREVATAEGRSRIIDSKIIRKVVDTLIAAGVCREIDVNKPSLTPSRKASFLRLLVLTGVESNGPEVRAFLSSGFKRSVVANKESLLPADAPSPAKRGRRRKGTTARIPGKRIRNANISEPLASAPDAESDVPLAAWIDSMPQHFNPLGLGGEPMEVDEPKPPANLDAYSAVQPDAEEEPRIVLKAVRAEEDPRVARVAKLRAVEYGWVRPKMQRLRLFHEHLVRHVLGDDFFAGVLAGGFDVVEHSTLEAASVAEDLGCFNLQQSFMAMRVRQFATIIGLHQDHGVIDSATYDLPMKEAPERIQAEAKSRTGTGKVRILFSVLLRLGLVHSAEDSSWVLRGAGVYRDFGRGIPEGKSSHSIQFSSPSSIRSYWDELESLASSSAVRSYVPDVSSFALSRKPASDKGEASEQHPRMYETAQVLDVYIPAAWLPKRSGNIRRNTEDELRMECVLQSIVSTTGWSDDYAYPKNISSWTPGVLRRITMDELYDNAKSLFPPSDKRRADVMKHFFLEKLLRYSQKRTFRPANRLVLLLATSNGPKSRKKRRSAGRWLSDNIASPVKSKKRRARKLAKSDDEEHSFDESEMGSEMTFAECVQFLIAVTEANTLSKVWQQQGLSFTTDESELKFWLHVTDAVQRPVEWCKLELQTFRKSDFIQRNMDFLCERLVERMVASDASAVEVGLDSVPTGVYDYLGEEIPIDAAVSSILRESGLTFLNMRMSFRLRRSKRKSILERLRCPSQIPISSATAAEEAVQKTKRRRKIAAYARSSDIHFGIMKKDISDPVDISSEPFPMGPSSAARTAVLSLILKMVLAEPESSFIPAAALYLLSRFPSKEVIATRNELFQQKHLSICEGRRRLFAVFCSSKPLETVYGLESLDAIAQAGYSIDSVVKGSETVSNSSMMKQICSEDMLVSQSTLCATVQGMFCERDNGVNLQLFSRVRERDERRATIRNTSVIVDFMKPASVDECEAENEQELSANEKSVEEMDESGMEAVSTPHESAIEMVLEECDARGSNERAKNESDGAETTAAARELGIGIVLQECDPVEKEKSRDANSGDLESAKFPLDASQMPIGEEWTLEIKVRRDREDQTIAYYESQMQSLGSKKENELPYVMWAVLDIIRQSGSSGVTSTDIGTQASEKGFPGDLVVQSVCALLKEGNIHRFACDDIKKLHGRSAVYFMTSYAWLFVAVPLLKSPARQCFVADWMSARPISPWTSMNGAYNAQLVKAVQMHIVSVLARWPGTEESALVRKVHWRELVLTARAILDAAMAMHRAGILRREVRKVGGGEVSLFGSPQAELAPETDSLIHRFPDGVELAGICGSVKVFYSLSGSRLGHLLDADDFEFLAKRTS